MKVSDSLFKIIAHHCIIYSTIKLKLALKITSRSPVAAFTHRKISYLSKQLNKV